jgi:hypothetical protein
MLCFGVFKRFFYSLNDLVAHVHVCLGEQQLVVLLSYQCFSLGKDSLALSRLEAIKTIKHMRASDGFVFFYLTDLQAPFRSSLAIAVNVKLEVVPDQEWLFYNVIVPLKLICFLRKNVY